MFRNATKYPVGLILALTGVRFSKVHRQYETIVYKTINTIGANLLAERIRPAKENCKII